MKAKGGKKSSIIFFSGFLILIVFISILFLSIGFILKTYAKSLVSFYDIMIALITLGAGYVLITYVNVMIVRFLSPSIGKSKAVTIKYLFSLVAYLSLAFVVFSVLKLNLEGLLVGSAFTGIVLGLAAQTVLSNFFSGLVLVLARPVLPGDRVTFATWQYAAVAPSYPPKFYSNDILINGFTGTVDYVGFLYVDVIMDDGRFAKIPAGIFIQAMIVNNSRSKGIKVRAKFEVEKSLDPATVISRIKDEMLKLKWLSRETVPDVFVYETTLNTYVVAADIMAESQFEEPVRSDMLQGMMHAVQELKSSMSSRAV